MPELPEVETIVRTLAPQVLGKSIRRVTVLHQKSMQYGGGRLPSLAGRRISRVFRRAKLLLMEATPPGTPGSPETLAFHLKMTGRFFVHPADAEPLKHTHLIFDLEGEGGSSGGRLFFDDMRTFGYCRLMRPDELEAWPFWQALGPEPLEASDADIASRFAARGGAIKAVLLDQTVVAGVGNIYADESLFRAGILPTARASAIPSPALERLARELKAVLLHSIEECGSSIRDYRDAQGNAGAFQNSFAVYGRKGEACRRCGGALAFARVAGRGTVYCPACQKG